MNAVIRPVGYCLGMTPEERQSLAAESERNEKLLESLPANHAQRSEIDARQDEIEYMLGMDDRRQRMKKEQTKGVVRSPTERAKLSRWSPCDKQVLMSCLQVGAHPVDCPLPDCGGIVQLQRTSGIDNSYVCHCDGCGNSTPISW